MLTPQEITRRRWEKGIKQTILQHFKNHVINDNNNAKKTQETSAGVKSKPKKKRKRKSNCFRTNSSEVVLNRVDIPEAKKSVVPLLELEPVPTTIKKNKFPGRRKPVKVSLVEFSVEEVGGELVTVNKHLYSTVDDEEFTIVIRDYLTPDDYVKTVDYYRQINAARQTYLKAALIVGDILQYSGQQSERDDWHSYLEQEEEAKKIWRRNCRRDEKSRERGFRYSRREFDNFYDEFKRISREVLQTFLKEFMDIFPCCFNE
ncbi:hypothetical protein SNE40_011971 [Patella caerulea]|uniref:Uncharacterized protein n=1 Tax=Patella caerulea TaxID=87958 RepID=A0AAN8JMJ9_PATCE